MPGAGIDQAALDELAARSRREVDEGFLPSCQIAVALDGELVYEATFGEATPDSRYVIFSATKAIVAGAFWLLLSSGDVTLDQRVAEIVPEFGTNGKDVITIRQLLLHEGGFPTAPLDVLADTTRDARLARFSSWRLNWEPGTRYEYHPTSAHWVIAALIEQLSGTDYREFIRTRVLEPLGLRRFQLGVPLDEQGDVTTLVPVGEPPTDAELEAVLGIPGITLADLQGEVTEAALLGLNDPRARAVGLPGGGGISTAGDLARYYQALLHNPGGLWDPAVLASGTREVHGTLADLQSGVSSNRALGTVIVGEGRDAALARLRVHRLAAGVRPRRRRRADRLRRPRLGGVVQLSHQRARPQPDPRGSPHGVDREPCRSPRARSGGIGPQRVGARPHPAAALVGGRGPGWGLLVSQTGLASRSPWIARSDTWAYARQVGIHERGHAPRRRHGRCGTKR